MIATAPPPTLVVLMVWAIVLVGMLGAALVCLWFSLGGGR